MLRKYSNSRSHSDNIKLGSLSAFAAGMINIGSLLLFFSFSSNITGHYAILASEIVKGNLYQVAVVFAWIFFFFLGSFISNLTVIHLNQKNSYIAHSIPLLLEILCLMAVSIYGDYLYTETLAETEFLLTLMLFAMGLQNGLTASISNFSIKTTHLTGTTTDLGILFSMFTKKEFRNNKPLRQRAILLSSILLFYLIGAIAAGFTYTYLNFKMFYVVSLVLIVIILYDFYKLQLKLYWHKKRTFRLTLPEIKENILIKKEERVA